LSTPPPSHPAYQPTPGPYAQYPHQAPGPYPHNPQAPGPYPPAPVWPQQYGGAGMPPGGPVAACQVCGATPAAPVTVRGHQGMVVVMRFLRREGMLCRTCALATFRDMQADTMVMGWWGPLSVLITPFTLLGNLGALSGIRRIPAPVTAGWRPPMDPGKPVFKRPAGILALIPLGLLGLVVFLIPVLAVIGMVVGPSTSSDNSTDGTDPSAYPTHYAALTVGSCARNDAAWPEEDLKAESCDSSAAQYSIRAWPDGGCASGDHPVGPMYSKDHSGPMCLRPLKR
jgi:hypothetical protein